MACAQGAQSRLLVEPGSAPHTFDSSSEWTAFLRENIKKKGRIVDSNAIRGSRSRHSAYTRVGAYEVGGSLILNAQPNLLDLWLPRCLGGALSSGSVALAETLPSFGILIDRVGAIFQYKNCMVDQWELRGQASMSDSQPELLELALKIMATDEVLGTSWPGTPPSEVLTNAAPYIHPDCVFTFAGGERSVIKWKLRGNNFLHAQKYNSLTATAFCPQDRLIELSALVTFGASEYADLYDQAVAGEAATIVMTNGNMSATFTLGTWQVADESPEVQGKTEIQLEIGGVARMVSTTRELVASLDSSP